MWAVVAEDVLTCICAPVVGMVIYKSWKVPPDASATLTDIDAAVIVGMRISKVSKTLPRSTSAVKVVLSEMSNNAVFQLPIIISLSPKPT